MTSSVKTNSQRAQQLGQKGAVIWFTGLSGSGKSTLSGEIEQALLRAGKNAFVLDGDNIRKGLNKDLGFSHEDRTENIRRIAEVAKLFVQANILCMVSFISPYREDRRAARALFEEGQFLEIYCAATIDECEKRDIKGLYKKARAGHIQDFTGISAPYEPPEHPELILRTGGQDTVSQSTEKVLALLRDRHLI